ncbi:MAG: hypothetical protein COA57_04340 [Flavobacteriales bacterium]|nr:MAG: hypothetical protein COA57_04340 [Flavobacteriales bacterium]
MVKTYEIIPPNIPSAGIYHFTTGSDIQYEVRFGRKQNDLLSATIVFGVINEEYEGEEYVLTNKGEVYGVMNTIVQIIKMFRKEHPNVRSYEFTGEPTEGETLEKPTKRLKLYHRYVKRMFDEKIWDVKVLKNKIVVLRPYH